MNWEVLFQAVGILVTLILGVAQFRSKHPTQQLKDALKDDLEIFSKLKPDDFGYEILRATVMAGITATYTVSRKRWYHVYNWDDLFIGVPIAGVFTYWTLIHMQTDNLWGFATAFCAVIGFAIIPDAFTKEIQDFNNEEGNS